MYHLIPPCRKNDAYWDSLILAECRWRSNSRCEYSEAMGGAFQQWWHWQWVVSIGAGSYERSMKALVHCLWKCIANAGDYVGKLYFVAENFLNSTVKNFLWVNAITSHISKCLKYCLLKITVDNDLKLNVYMNVYKYRYKYVCIFMCVYFMYIFTYFKYFLHILAISPLFTTRWN